MEERSMNEMETARLVAWLLSKGFTEKDAVECIRYITTGEEEAGQK